MAECRLQMPLDWGLYFTPHNSNKLLSASLLLSYLNYSVILICLLNFGIFLAITHTLWFNYRNSMRKTLILVAFIVVGSSIITSCRKSVPNSGLGHGEEDPEPEQPEVIETQPAILSPFSENISINIKGYYEALPSKYEETTIRYPLILFFHGGGQYGDGTTKLSKVLLEGIPKQLNANTFPPSFSVNNRSYSFIVVAPQFRAMPTNADIDAMLEHIKSKLRIDTTRIYLSGFSLGARMLSNYAAYKPYSIAAITSMAGLPQINENLETRCAAMANAKLPIWHVHNVDDTAWAYSEAVTYINTLKSYNPAIVPKFTTFQVGQGKSHHDCWTRTMDPAYKEDNKNIYEWMLSYKR